MNCEADTSCTLVTRILFAAFIQILSMPAHSSQELKLCFKFELIIIRHVFGSGISKLTFSWRVKWPGRCCNDGWGPLWKNVWWVATTRQWRRYHCLTSRSNFPTTNRSYRLSRLWDIIMIDLKSFKKPWVMAYFHLPLFNPFIDQLFALSLI